jgi:hypothetical protein
MDVISVIHKILIIANPVICETALPDFSLATEDRPKSMGIAAFDQLNRVLKRNVIRRSEQKMDVFGHDDEGVNLKSSFAAVSV